MSVPFHLSATHYVTRSVLEIVGSVSIVVICLIHGYNFVKHEIGAEQSKNKQQAKASSILTLLMLLFFALTKFYMTLDFFDIIGGCNPDQLYWAPMLYHIAKACMFSIFIHRLYLVYDKSIYAYNHTLLIIMVIVVWVSSLTFGITEFILSSYLEFTVNAFGSKILVCKVIAHPTVCTMGLGVDIIYTIVTLLTYIIPLRKIGNSLKENYGQEQATKDLKKPAIKVLILSMTAMATSIMAFLISAELATEFIFSVDIPLNCVCVILMVTYYDGIYTKLCCGLIRCVETCENNDKIIEDKTNKTDDVDHTYHDTEFQTRTNMDHDIEMMSQYQSRENTEIQV